MVSERSILTLDIGGDSQSAVESANAVAEALEHLNQTTSQATTASKGASEAGGNFNGVLNEMTGTLRTVNPEMGELASTAGKLIGSGGEGLLGVAGAGVAAVGSFVALGMAGGDLLNTLNQLSAVTGLSIERADFWSKAMEDAGGSAETLSRSSIMLQRTIESINTAMEKGTDLDTKQTNVVKLLGGTIKDANGELMSSGQAVEQLLPALASITDVNERARLGVEAFGRSWGTIAPLVANYTEVTEAAARQSERLAQAMGVDASDAAIQYNIKMGDLKTSMEVLEVTTLPAVISVLDKVSNALQHIVDFGVITVKIVSDVSGFKLPGGLSFGDLAKGAFGAVIPEASGPMAALSWLFSGPGGASHPSQQPIGTNFWNMDPLSQHLANGGGVGANTPPGAPGAQYGPGYGSDFVASMRRAEEELTKAKKQEEEDAKRAAAEAKRSAEAMEKFNDAMGKATQGLLNLDAVRSAVQSLFGKPTREQADLQVKVDEQKAFEAKYGPTAVHFGPGQGVGTGADAEKRLAQLDAQHKVEQDRITAANALLITEGQQAQKAEELRDLTRDQSTLIRDKLNPSITDLYPEINTARSAFVSLADFVNGGMGTALLGFAKKLSDFEVPTLATSPGSTSSTPSMTAGG